MRFVKACHFRYLEYDKVVINYEKIALPTRIIVEPSSMAIL